MSSNPALIAILVVAALLAVLGVYASGTEILDGVRPVVPVTQRDDLGMKLRRKCESIAAQTFDHAPSENWMRACILNRGMRGER